MMKLYRVGFLLLALLFIPANIVFSEESYSLESHTPASIKIKIVDKDDQLRSYSIASTSGIKKFRRIWNKKRTRPLTDEEKGKLNQANPTGPYLEITARFFITRVKEGTPKGRKDRHAVYDFTRVVETTNYKVFDSESIGRVSDFVKTASREDLVLPMFTNSIGMDFVKVPTGSFRMGSKGSHVEVQRRFHEHGEAQRFADEHPQHLVKITNNFYAGAHEVSVSNFQKFVDSSGYRTTAERDGSAVDGFNPTEKVEGEKSSLNWRIGEPEEPVAYVSWEDANQFVSWLKDKEGRNYRLPTEAEWEYFTRAGTTSYYNTGDSPHSLCGFANLPDLDYLLEEGELDHRIMHGSDGYSGRGKVGSFKPNPFGLYDTHGNVFEWCFDGYASNAYSVHGPVNPFVKTEGTSLRVIRGGCYM